MYEELYAPLPDIDKYLSRIGIQKRIRPDFEGLSTLVQAQLTHIPFDDMDVWGPGACPSLATEDLFNKIVTGRRGGYCFELNSLFCHFLKALGFEAYMAIVRLLEGKDHVPPPAHCCVICIIDGKKYFCDVGYGGQVPYGAVAMDGQEHIGYRVLRSAQLCTVQRMENGEPVTIMEFNDIPVFPVELIPLNYYISQLPDSRFRNTLLVNLRLPGGGAYSINGALFKIHSSQSSSVTEIRDISHLKEILKEYFGMDADRLALPEKTIQ